MKIVWTRLATRHLRAARDYWAREQSKDAADSMLEHIFSTIELLEHNPELGRIGRVRSTRELVLKPLPFLLAYRVRRNRIEILAVLHGARKWPSTFE